MTTTSLISSSGAVLTTTCATLGDDGKIDKDKRNATLGTTAVTAGTLVGATIAEKNTMNEIYEKYSSAYIDSMTDEELALALEQLDLLESSMSENTTKTI